MTNKVRYEHLDAIPELLADGLITRRPHPELPLHIHNYTARAQYSENWTVPLMDCRGLILDAEGYVVARPFRKFFNLEQLTGTPNEPFEVYEKVDGSLFLATRWEGHAVTATRGSFTSDHSDAGRELLRSKYPRALAAMSEGVTYCCEVVYPDNKVVVDYGGRSELTLLAALDTATGRDLPLEDIGLPVVRRHHGFRDFQTIKALGESAEYRGQEGFVIRWESGLRAKVKFADYVRLHKLIFGCSNLTIWEALRAGEGLDAILERVPDELYGWVRKTERELAESFAATDRLIRAEYGRVIERLGANAERKAYAEEFRRSKYSGFLFSLLDGKDYRDRLWKEIRPREFLPFKTDGEDL